MNNKYFYWDTDESELCCVKCHEPVSRMKIQTNVKILLGDDDIVDEIYVFYCEDWEYGKIQLVCSCGVIIPETEFDWDCYGDTWELRISKEDI